MDTETVWNSYAPGGFYAPGGTFGPCIEDEHCSHTTPIFFNITLLPCPPGFTSLDQCCDCYLTIFTHCSIINGTGYFSWNTNVWVKTDNDGVIYDTTYCPFDYCNITGKWIDLLNDPDSQCAFNRAGRLCGGCRENYSLAIGSSHCVQCPNNNNLAVFIYFAAAGFLLIVFISVLNFTVTQGMINGLIFYANIIWSYHSIMLPCLLYTSPSPRDATLSRMPSSA